MKLRIQINMDNAAFEAGGVSRELRYILNQLIEDFETGVCAAEIGERGKALDSNGNTVCAWRVEA